jgi:hypothetical protein
MIFDDLLLAMIIGGIGLTGAYLRCEFVRGRKLKAAEQSRNSALRELHAHIRKMPRPA